jgi:hypothetical protein
MFTATNIAKNTNANDTTDDNPLPNGEQKNDNCETFLNMAHLKIVSPAK